MIKNKIALFLFLIGSGIISSRFYVVTTGNLTGGFGEFSYLTFVGLIFIMGSFALFFSRKSLDLIVIPTAGYHQQNIRRVEGAEKNQGDLIKNNGYIVISGMYEKGSTEKIRKSPTYEIYKHLRSHGVAPRNMILEGNSYDTEENLLYTLKKARELANKTGRSKPLDIGFVSYPSHLDRLEDFYNEAIKKGLIGQGEFRFHKIPTPETREERAYESNIAVRALHHYKLNTMGRFKSKNGEIKQMKEDPIVKGVKKTAIVVQKLIGKK